MRLPDCRLSIVSSDPGRPSVVRIGGVPVHVVYYTGAIAGVVEEVTQPKLHAMWKVKIRPRLARLARLVSSRPFLIS